MKPKLVFSLALVLNSFIFVQRTFGLMNEEQLKPTEVSNSQCSVKAESTADGIHFSCQIRKGQSEENDLFYATLRIYDGTNLVAICPVEKTNDARFVHCQFTVEKGYLENSRFYITEIFRNKDGHQMPSGIQYWFYLRDFADVK
jgi:hypothetical protein